MIMLSDTQRRITLAKLQVKQWMPACKRLLSRMGLIETAKVPTAAVDKFNRLYCSPAYAETCSPGQLAYTVLHELSHIMLNHFSRFVAISAQPTEHEMLAWNLATDLSIQQMLIRHEEHEPSGIVRLDAQVPGCGLRYQDIPGLQPGMRSEQYYSLLLPLLANQESDDQADEGGDQDADQDGDQGGEQDADQGSQDGDQDADQDDSQGDSQDDQGDSQGNRPGSGEGDSQGDQGSQDGSPGDGASMPVSGSGADGQPRDWELPGDVEARAVLDSDLRQLDAELAGSPPGTIEGHIAAALDVKLRPVSDPWARIVRLVNRSVPASHGSDAETYAVRNRRQRRDKPRMIGVEFEQPEATIIIDTSGSMMGAEQRAFDAIATGLRRVDQPRVIAYDTQLQSAQRLTSAKKFAFVGYGGTDMRQAVIDEDKRRPDLIVVVTDGETHWPEERTRAKLVVILVKKLRWMPEPPAWAKVINATVEEKSYGC